MGARSLLRGGRVGEAVMLLLAAMFGGALVLAIAFPELARLADSATASPTAPGATSTGSGAAPSGSRDPIAVIMSPGADCAACHLNASGGVDVALIPVMAHPLAGWEDCTACHADDRLVKTAPGHSGLHRSDCLICHRAPAPGGSPPPRPHHVVTDASCESCHGTTAPLPTDMAGRHNCWICHTGAEFSQLFGSPAPSLSPPGSGPLLPTFDPGTPGARTSPLPSVMTGG